MEILDNQINIAILGAIFLLAIIDIVFKKDLKSQIVSLGVLGTFIGIFIGLQDFNPEDMKNSINSILLGLKTAFFTSIVGMGTALILSIIQKIFSKKSDNSTQKSLLLEISKKLDTLEKLDGSKDTDKVILQLKQSQKIQIDTQNETVKIFNEIKKSSNNERILLEIYKKMDSSQDTDKIISELKQLRNIQTDTRDETSKIYSSIDELRENSNRENQKLIEILDSNFSKMNNSLEIAIDKLSKGATEEIIRALEHVIKEFNNELQSSFGDNFTKLNEAVVNLLEWQNNYKTHIEHIEQHLNISTSSIEKSKESLEIISSKNEAVLLVYKQLKNIIHIYHHQIKELNQHLETYSSLSDNAENMFLNITKNISKTTEEFEKLTDVISSSNQEQKKSFLSNNEEIMESHSILTQHIKDENSNQVESHKELLKQNNQEFSNLAQTISSSNQEQKKSFISNNEKIMESHSILTQHIKNENANQAESHKELLKQNHQEFSNLAQSISSSNQEQKKSFLSNNEKIMESHSILTQHIKDENANQAEFNKELFNKNNQEFSNLAKTISSNNQEQKESFLSNNEEIMESHSILTQHIKNENANQAESHKELLNQNNEDFSNLAKTISVSNKEIKKAHLDLTKNIKSENEKQIKFNKELFSKNKEELDNITKHFNNLGEEIPKALQISLNELNRGLTSLTKEFQKSYKEIMDKYKNGIDNER